MKGGWGASPGYPGDRKCLLPVASCLFPTSHFSVCLPPARPHPSHSGITSSWGVGAGLLEGTGTQYVRLAVGLGVVRRGCTAPGLGEERGVQASLSRRSPKE